MIVQKYGGSSVATTERIRNVAGRIKERVIEGEKLIVVVSAMGKTTNQLIELAREISKKPEPREMDMLLSTGEQMSAALLAMSLQEMGIKSVSYNAFHLELVTTGEHSDARIMDMNLERVERELKQVDVIVVTGFQGVNPSGDITTLGRGGSDTSAVAIAAKMGIPCEIYSDVAGIFTCDPRVHSLARKLEYITYDEMLEMAALGAKVLHSRAVEIAKKYSVDLYCASTFSSERGTYVVNNLPEWLEQPVVTGVTMDSNQMKVTLNYFPNDIQLMSKLFNALAEKAVNVDMISTVMENGHSHLTFTVVAGNMKTVKDTVEDVLKEVEGWEFNEDSGVTKISAIGVGMRSNAGVAARFFSALGKEKIKVLATTTSEIKISALVPKEEAGKAVKELIDEFGL